MEDFYIFLFIVSIPFFLLYYFHEENSFLFYIVISGIIVLILMILYYRHKKYRNRMLAIESIEEMCKLHRREFEEFITFVFKEKGFKVKIGLGLKDGGIDVYATKNKQEYLIQCKKWSKYKVTEPNIREFFGAIMSYNKDAYGIYITTSKLTKEAKKFAEKNGIEIWDQFSLVTYVRLYLGKVKKNNCTTLLEHGKDFDLNKADPIDNSIDINNLEEGSDVIICEKCGGNMVLRIAKKGVNCGNKFYGCSNYPKCRNIVNINNLFMDK